MAKDEQSEKLLATEDQHEESYPNTILKRQARQLKTWKLHVFSLYAVNLSLLAAFIILAAKMERYDPSQITYSPANTAIEYEEVVFEDMPGSLSPYFGDPSDEKDTIWDQLYRDTGVLLYSPEETRKMPNKTVAIPGPNGDRGIYDLEVFHELHCLNVLRKSIYPERYPEYSTLFPNGTRDKVKTLHLNHCVDRLRQGVQCAGNIGANYYYWNEDYSKWRVDMRSTHTCRKFSNLQKWARARDYKGWDPRERSHGTGEN